VQAALSGQIIACPVPQLWVVVVARLTTKLCNTGTKVVDKSGGATDWSHFMRTFNGTMTTFHRRPPFQAPIYNLPSARAAEREDDQMPTENLSELLGRVSENSTSQIDDLVGDFGRLREKLRTDGDRIQREIEEYSRLSQQVMQLTKTIFENVEKVRASVKPQEKE
jgi:hypothetical protein